MTEYTDWLARMRRARVPLAPYCCPECDGEIECVIPPEGQVYDTLACCPHCGGYHFRVVTADGVVTAWDVEHEEGVA